MLNVSETARAVRSRRTSAVEVVEAALQRVAAEDDRLGAFLSVAADQARTAAAEVDRRVAAGVENLPLAGVPLAIKDNICTDFGTTTCASLSLRDYRAPYAATVVTRLVAAGAVIVGKTNLDEFAMGSSTENSALQVTRNPWDPTRVPGGSSGGSAVAVAADLVPAALGSDTGGSIRQPAAFTGVCGLKPSYGRVSRHGLIAYGSSLDQIGPLARTAEDLALLLGVISGPDPRDSTCLDVPVPDFAGRLAEPVSGLRLGLPREYFGDGLDPQIREAVLAAVDVLRSAGVKTVELELPHMRYGIACYYLLATAEASSNLARFDGVHYGRRTPDADDIIALYAGSRAESLGPEVKRRIMLGTYALSAGYYDAYYLRASKVRTLLRRDFERAFAQVDVIASPVTPTTAFPLGEKVADPLAMYLADIYTICANLAGIPALSIPCGRDDRGLPIGLQLMGPTLAEERLLRVARRYQMGTDHHLQRPG